MNLCSFEYIKKIPSIVAKNEVLYTLLKGGKDMFSYGFDVILMDKSLLSTDDAFVGMEWMTEKIDLSELDLDSLIGSCSSDDSPSSPEDLLASLDSQMDLDIDSFDTAIPTLNTSLELGLSLPSIHSLPLELPIPGEKTEGPPPQEVLKSEPLSPAPSPSLPSPDDTLELGSEVDVLGAEKMALSITAAITPDPSRSIQSTTPIVLSLPPTIVVVLANKEEHPQISLPDQSINVSSQSSDSDSDSGIESIGSSPTRLPSPPSTPSPTAGSSRTKPYSRPQATAASTTSVKISKVKLVSGAPKLVEKKLKKMEQNKTAATRYRQKKRFEQEKLGTELEGLEKRNSELTEKAESISREIKYLKDLMEEVRKHRRGKTSSVTS